MYTWLDFFFGGICSINIFLGEILVYFQMRLISLNRFYNHSYSAKHIVHKIKVETTPFNFPPTFPTKKAKQTYSSLTSIVHINNAWAGYNSPEPASGNPSEFWTIAPRVHQSDIFKKSPHLPDPRQSIPFIFNENLIQLSRPNKGKLCV